MKHFFTEHILFPKRFGLLPYFLLVFLIPNVSYFIPLDSVTKGIFFLLLLVFLKAYRDGYEVTKHLQYHFFIQLIISLLFGIFLGNGYLFIFTAWEIGSLPIGKKRFQQFLIAYYSACAISIGWGLLHADLSMAENGYSLFIALLFSIISPLVARSVQSSYQQSYRLAQQNQRLESIIRQGERERIAQDLHDNLGQAFSIITMKTELAAKLLEKKPEAVQKELIEIAETSRKNLSMVREIVSNLQERTIAKTMIEEEKNIRVADILLYSKNEELAENWPLPVQDVCSAVIKEAVTNMIRHSKASLAEIIFGEAEDSYCMTIRDNGDGFTTIREGAHGLTGMRNRVESFHGCFSIMSKDGTVLEIKIPNKSFKKVEEK